MATISDKRRLVTFTPTMTQYDIIKARADERELSVSMYVQRLLRLSMAIDRDALDSFIERVRESKNTKSVDVLWKEAFGVTLSIID